MKKNWDKFYRSNGRFYLLPHPELKKFIKIMRTFDVLNVLDIGCGSGNNLIRLAEEGFDVTGLDYSTVAAHLAEEHLRKNGLNGKVYTGDYHSSLENFEESFFDSIIAINTLQYIIEESVLREILTNIQKILRSNGTFFMVVPSKNSIIIEPDTPHIYWDQTEIRSIFDDFFNVKEVYEDEHKATVIISTLR